MRYLFYLFVAWVLVTLVEANKEYRRRQHFDLEQIQMPGYVHEIPGNRHNYRANRMSPVKLDSTLKTGMIQRVIRLYGDEPDNGGMPTAQEAAICKRRQAAFHYVDIQAPGAAEAVHTFLLQGRTLIHCLNGYSATGAMVGYHLRRRGHSFQAVIKYNRWENQPELEAFGRFIK